MIILKKLLIELKLIFEFIIEYFPGNIGVTLRRIYFNFRFKNLGKSFYSEIGFSTTCPKNIIVGENASFMKNCSLNSCLGKIKIGKNISVNKNVDINSSNEGEIIIGDDVLIGNNVVIRASDHSYKNKNKNINLSGHIGGKIIIGNNVWIGANSVILKNVIIGDNVVIAAGTIVKKNINSNTLAISNKQNNLEIKYIPDNNN